ncbi:hypothetical protein EJ04DRAFT_565196 [Polyplosphaeria fusca]|uniref:Uncharacterized protein n=1 Tax=Polyplosphaeria fusca TaxID=682080 RepID=A0A9P4V2G0_9PLEO|nr:hypothetical protein EJ04DRAFT_565196 [Polyplosphaeria fusca]
MPIEEEELEKEEMIEKEKDPRILEKIKIVEMIEPLCDAKRAAPKSDVKQDETDQEAAQSEKKAAGTKNMEWSQAANRTSVITHFRFNAKSKQGQGVDVRFDMLFTGDAFEAGAADKGPYASHLQHTLKDFQLPLAVRNNTIEPPENFIANPGGNLLTWLWQHSGLNGIRVGVLKLPHHGASRTTNALFYRLVSASVYLISGANSPHGHPRPETITTIINTIIHQDGSARPPTKFLSVRTSSSTENKDLLEIENRPRPRLIFATFGTRKEKLLTDLDRRIMEAEFRKQMAESKEWRNGTGWDSSEGGERNNGANSDDEVGNMDEEGKSKKERNYMDLQEYDYFHSRNLGGMLDQPKDEAERLMRQQGKDVPIQANVRIFFQKEASTASRLNIGIDKMQPKQVRVEWRPEDCDEIRADKAPANPWDDPVAYPSPGENPD